MFQVSQLELARFQHSHGSDDWHDMVEVASSHDSAGSDPERSWARGRIFRCSTCTDEIRVMSSDQEPPSQR